MSFKTQTELVAFSTGVFYENTIGAITPTNFKDMNQHIADSMVPYDASGVFQINTTPTGNVPTPTPTGAMIWNTDDGHIQVFDGANWLTFQPM
ncbi:hypothetical protein OAQ45_00340 [Candidatus Marinimicrobia bacterium]|nr:hypothetical protein [Candidatus Neomarinimicrobiota bacterium]